MISQMPAHVMGVIDISSDSEGDDLEVIPPLELARARAKGVQDYMNQASLKDFITYTQSTRKQPKLKCASLGEDVIDLT